MRARTFFAMIVPLTCCTFITLPPFPEPSSCNSVRSSSLRSSRFEFMSRLASVLSAPQRGPDEQEDGEAEEGTQDVTGNDSDVE